MPGFGLFRERMREAMMQDPRLVYSQLLEERRADIASRERRHRMLGYGKLAAAASGVLLVWMGLSHTASIVWVLLPAVILLALSVLHEHVLRLMERLRRAVRYFEKALARLDGKWAGIGETGDRYVDPAHPYAQDLDLFGRGSLFELLCTARTHVGEDTLARWLLSPATPEVVHQRHEALDELRPRVDLREDLAVAGEETRTGVDPISLAAWGEAAPSMSHGRLRLIMWLL